MSRVISFQKIRSYFFVILIRRLAEKNLWRMPELFSNKSRDCFVASLLAMTILALPFAIKADVVDDLNSKIAEQKKQWQVLEDQRQEYIKSLKQKKTAAANLENQIALLDGEISFTETNIKQTETQLKQVFLEIEKFNAEITKKQRDISRQKEILSVLFRELFNEDGKNLLTVFLDGGAVSELLNNSSDLEQVQNKINISIDDLKNIKEQLEWQRKEELSKKEEYDTLKINLVQENEELSLNKNSKVSLLKKTKGEQSRYEDLLKRAEEQRGEILGNIEELQKKKAKELEKIQSKQFRPDPNLKAEMWHYYQTDSRWGDSFIGFSGSTMKQYGCAVAALAMIFQYHNAGITPGQLARQPIFYYDLIKWPQTWRGLNLGANEYRTPVNWSKVDANLAAGHPVIVFVRAIGKNAGHYVVVFNKDSRGYIVNDSMWGSNIYLDSTRQNIGTLYDTTTIVEQMIVYK